MEWLYSICEKWLLRATSGAVFESESLLVVYEIWSETIVRSSPCTMESSGRKAPDKRRREM